MKPLSPQHYRKKRRQNGGSMAKVILSWVAQNLSILLIQEPGLLNGLEEEINSIYLGLGSLLREPSELEEFRGIA